MPSITDLILRQGDVQARGAEAQGQIWSGLATELGRLPAQTYAQILENRQQQQQQQLRDVQVQKGQQEIQANQQNQKFTGLRATISRHCLKPIAT